MPPTPRPFPRFIAEQPQELEPYGRWAEQLAELFLAACKAIESEEDLGDPEEIAWYPERTHAGRTYVPAAATASGGVELFGYVSFTRLEDSSEAEDFFAQADYATETAEHNPHWKLDLNEEVLGQWRGPGDASGELTLVWGRPLVPGGRTATAELDGETLDQCVLVQSDRFTLVALDAVSGIGPDLFLEVKLWDKRNAELASETLYADEDAEGE